MSTFEEDLQARLDELRTTGLGRRVRRVDSAQSTRIEIEGRSLLNFSSNDYLGFANEPSLKQAAIDAVHKYGAGSGASRLICGSLAPHHQLEEALAEFKGAEAALAFGSGYAAALGAITALLGKDDVIVLDKLVHACLVDAARLSGARIRVFAHGDLGQLEDILRWVNRRVAHPAGGSVVVSERPSRTLIVTESVFSMDGDRASLREIVELKDKYGAWLMVDEAHAAGLYGERRRGLAEACGVAAHIEVQMGTLGKALGAAGGYICGSGRLIDLLVNKARSFIFTTAPVPAAAAAAAAGVRLVQSDAGGDRNGLLWKRVAQFSAHPLIQERLVGRGLLSKPDATSETKSCGPAGMAGGVPTHGSAIFPIIIGAEESAMEVSAALRQRGVWVPAVRYPSVPRGQARLRVTLTAPHTPEEIDRLLDALSSAVPAAIKI